MTSPRYANLKPSTKKECRSILGRFLHGLEDLSLAALDRRYMNAILGGMAENPEAVNKLLKRLKTVMRFAIDIGMLEVNPLHAVRKPYRTDSEGFSLMDGRRDCRI